MIEKALISIICPLYNKKNYVLETINSVLNQTYTNWELLIVDDGSTDGSYELVNIFIKEEENIRLLKRVDYKQNKGGSVCRNIGIQQAKGDFVIFLDADDVLSPFCLEKRLKLAYKYPHKDYYIFNHNFFKKNIQQTESRGILFELQKVTYHFSCNKRMFFLKNFLKYNILFSITGILWKKEVLNELKGFDEQYQRLQDPEIHTRVLLGSNYSFRSFLFSEKPDFSIRKDINRHKESIGDEDKKISIYINTVLLYVSGFSKYLRKRNQRRGLSGYLYFLHCMINHEIHKNPKNKTKYLEYKKSIFEYQERYVGKNLFFILFCKLHSVFISHKFARLIKLPVVNNIVYKFIFL